MLADRAVTVAATATGGRVLPAPDLAIGDTIVHAFELPPLDDTLANVPRLAVAAAGSGPGWRGAALLLSTDGGATWAAAGATALPATLGHVVTPPGIAAAGLADRINAIQVALAHDAMMLADADDTALDAGANLAMVGDELIQFARAEPLGGTSWRLSGLWRGRRGTDVAIATHVPGERFVLVDREALRAIDLAGGTPASGARILAQGVGDVVAASASAAMTGISLAPPTPVHLTAAVDADGNTRIGWVRRSRSGWRWIDGLDAPLGEETERYRITLLSSEGAARTIETIVPSITLTATERGTGLTLRVQQIGTHALSPFAELELPPLGESG